MRLNGYFMAAALSAALIAPAGLAARAFAQDPDYRQNDPNYHRDNDDRQDSQHPDYNQKQDQAPDANQNRDYGHEHDHSGDYMQMARERGFQDGMKDGEHDRSGHHSFRPTNSDDYKKADAGYRSDYGDKREYRDLYRQAYEDGYRKAFYGNSRDHDHDRDH